MSSEAGENSESSRLDVISYLAPNMRRLFSGVPDDLLDKTDLDLEEMFSPTAVDWGLRRRLWKLYEQATKGVLEEIQPVDIYEDICSRQNFFRLIKNPLKLSWYSIPPMAYDTLLDRGLYLGLSKVIEYVQRTKIDAKNFGKFLQLVEQFANRVVGPVTQKLETKNLSVNFSHDVGALSNPESVNKKLEELKTKLLRDSAAEDVVINAE